MPGFRAAQILEWVYEKGVIDPEQMSNLSKLDRATLARDMTFLSGSVLAHQSASDGTQKLLMRWDESGGPLPPEVADRVAEAPDTTPDADGTVRLRVLGAPALSPRDATSVVGEGGTLPGKDSDSKETECVLIPSLDTDGPGGLPMRRTACISSQVGCPVGCRFCASGLGGLDGNLSAGRIVEQVDRKSVV